MDHCVIETPAGTLLIWELHGYITECAWAQAPLRAPETPLLKEAAEEVAAYFRGERRDFDLPIAPPGTPLSQKVGQVLLTIPYGKTMTAAEVARRAGLAKKVRAVIAAVNANPLALFIPCHRVTAEDGDGGYVGGLAVKHALWAVEHIRQS